MSWFRRKKPLVRVDVVVPAAPTVGVYDAALAAPIPAPELESDQAGFYTVVYRAANGKRREKTLWAETPQFARQLSDAHEAEYCALTGAELYPFDRIDYPEEQQTP